VHLAAGLVWPDVLNKDRPAMAAPAITCHRTMAPVDAANLEAVLNHDLEQALKAGPLAPGSGGGTKNADANRCPSTKPITQP
jgi:hypothetical protein